MNKFNSLNFVGMDKYMQYVNSTMSEINDLCSELYESLADKDYNESSEVIKKLSKVLRDIQKSNDE